MARYDSLVYFDSGVTYDEPDTPTVIKPTHMMDLHKFLINPFDDPGISMDELLAFTTDHLQKMTANNPGGIYSARLTATQTALTGVSSAFTDDQTKLGLRKARKQAKDAFRSTLAKKISPLALAVQAKFGEGSPEFTECFPQGRKIFSDCTDDKVANHLQTLINGVTAHQPDLGAQVVTDATALLTGWNAVYAPSESASGAKTTTEAAKAAARGALQLELFKNLLTIALNNPRLPDNLDDYMQPSLLMDHPVTPATPPTPSPTPPGP
jgi:hypothetical protein